MSSFLLAHATHPQWHMAARLVVAQLRAQLGQVPPAIDANGDRAWLGLIYLTDYYVDSAADLMTWLNAQLPEVSDWAGTVGVGVLATGAEYIDEPALAVMLCALPRAQFRVFSSESPLGSGFAAHSALIHADTATPDLAGRLGTLVRRSGLHYAFGGLASSRSEVVHVAASGADQPAGVRGRGGVFMGAELSGVAFGSGVALHARLAHACRPLARERVITEAHGKLVITLDGEPALDVMLDDLGVNLAQAHQALITVRDTYAALTPAHAMPARFAGQLGDEATVRGIAGVDPARSGVALTESVAVGDRLSFCRPDVATARQELMRVASELREELEPDSLDDATVAARVAVQMVGNGAVESGRALRGNELGVAGAVYVSCASRGGPFFGGAGAELSLLRHALGDVPTIGFFAAGEIMHSQWHAHTGVLTLFVDDEPRASAR